MDDIRCYKCGIRNFNIDIIVKHKGVYTSKNGSTLHLNSGEIIETIFHCKCGNSWTPKNQKSPTDYVELVGNF